MKKAYLAEMVGTMVLVLLGCGAAIVTGCDTPGDVLMTALAFGIAVVSMAYTIGGVSGCHINPAITLGAYLTKRIDAKDCGMYMAFQVIGALIGSVILFVLTTGTVFEGGTGANTLQTANGVDVLNGFLAEVFFTCVFVLVVLGTTDPDKGAGKFAGLAIGLSLVVVHICCIPFTGTSVNPARSIAPALFASGEALKQLWIFIVAPFVGAALAAVCWNWFGATKKQN